MLGVRSADDVRAEAVSSELLPDVCAVRLDSPAWTASFVFDPEGVRDCMNAAEEQELRAAELREAVRELDRAVHELIGARVMHDDQGTFTAPSILTELCSHLHQRPRQPGGKTMFESQPALWLDAFDLKSEIEASVRTWAGRSGDAQSLLDDLTRDSYATHHASWLRAVARQIAGFAARAAALLSDQPRELNLKDPCPAVVDGAVCGATVHLRHVDGPDEPALRTTALVVSLDPSMMPTGVRCRECGSRWEQYEVMSLGDTLRSRREQVEGA